MTDKLPRESHVKQLLVDSTLCFSFDRPVTDNCPILVLKKMYKIEKILPVASSCTLLISTEMVISFQSCTFFSFFSFHFFIQKGFRRKTCLKIDKTKILMTNGSLMKVKSIAECSPWSILQYF